MTWPRRGSTRHRRYMRNIRCLALSISISAAGATAVAIATGDVLLASSTALIILAFVGPEIR